MRNVTNPFVQAGVVCFPGCDLNDSVIYGLVIWEVLHRTEHNSVNVVVRWPIPSWVSLMFTTLGSESLREATRPMSHAQGFWSSFFNDWGSSMVKGGYTLICALPFYLLLLCTLVILPLLIFFRIIMALTTAEHRIVSDELLIMMVMMTWYHLRTALVLV